MAVSTEFVRRKHAYTSVNLPWEMDSAGDRALFRYLRGGGMRTFATTNAIILRARRQTRFLICAGILWFLWLVFFFV